MKAPHVEYRNVQKSYDGRVLVVEDLNLAVETGEFLTLLGPSGSGKTTCLMMLAGFEQATSGAILVNGESVHDLPPDKRGIGVVFQNYALFPHMSVGGNLAFPLEVRRLPAPERAERVARALGLVQLEGFEDRRPAELSGGQQQRVAIARALVFEPGLVLMDEPLGALDRRLREEMQFEIRRIQRELGVTVIYVTHDQQEAMVMSDRVAVFRDGRIEQVAAPETLYEEPERAFVAHFIGENNLLAGTVVGSDGDICVVDTQGGTVHAFDVAGSAPGDEVLLAIRPERVGVQPDGVSADSVSDDSVSDDTGHYANELAAAVVDVVFIGDHLRVRLKVGERDDFIAKIPNIVGHGRVLPGDTVRIGWATLDCRALPPDPTVLQTEDDR
ncbi:MAG: ABC transporter ATP-binding protein [Gammaproteobacteria bacterium]|nr:ABC transporter ATP-binding protein [Gammaproteobacteria bacterium]